MGDLRSLQGLREGERLAGPGRLSPWSFTVTGPRWRWKGPPHTVEASWTSMERTSDLGGGISLDSRVVPAVSVKCP